MIHELKTWPEYFEKVWDAKKPFEIRENDRGFAVGDVLRLLEFDPEKLEYSGRSIDATITYVGRDLPGLKKDYVALGTLTLLHGFVAGDPRA